LAEISKYDFLLNELTSVQTQISVLADRIKDLSSKNNNLEKTLLESKKEKNNLMQKISLLEKEIAGSRNHIENLFNSFNNMEKETLKERLQNLISRIDYHLSSVR
jgi:peptidoglycan hydrolase CwlO-like protein